MANHSPEKDNYIAKKTWDAAMDGEAPDVKPEGTRKKVQKQENEARGNGGKADE